MAILSASEIPLGNLNLLAVIAAGAGGPAAVPDSRGNTALHCLFAATAIAWGHNLLILNTKGLNPAGSRQKRRGISREREE
jgi:hypothetical protein